jgi:hypothetical protein
VYDKQTQHLFKRVQKKYNSSYGLVKYDYRRSPVILLGNENTSFNFTKTKQSSYYLNLFHESIYFRICVGFPRNIRFFMKFEFGFGTNEFPLSDMILLS